MNEKNSKILTIGEAHRLVVLPLIMNTNIQADILNIILEDSTITMKPYFETKLGKLYHGDCLEVMKQIPDNSVDTIITDPPYGLEFMGKEWDSFSNNTNFHNWNMEWAKEALRIAKPGAILMAFGGSRTYHRLTCALEDAGWQIRDCIMWVYGSGFPKSHNISKAIDKAAGAKRQKIGVAKGVVKQNPAWNGTAAGRKENYLKPEYDLTVPATPEAKLWDGYGTALKPAYEPIVLVMKNLDGTFAGNALKWGVAGLWIDGGRIPGVMGKDRALGKPRRDTNIYNKANQMINPQSPLGRWPANIIFECTCDIIKNGKHTYPECPSNILDEQSGVSDGGKLRIGSKRHHSIWNTQKQKEIVCNAPDNYCDRGGASRFFYCAKASRAERNMGCEGLFILKENVPEEDLKEIKHLLSV